MSDHTNPLLARTFPVPFDRIGPGDVGPAVTEALTRAGERIEELGAGSGGSYEDVVGELDAITEEVERTWSPVSHLHNVDATPGLREAYASAWGLRGGPVSPIFPLAWSLMNRAGQRKESGI